MAAVTESLERSARRTKSLKPRARSSKAHRSHRFRLWLFIMAISTFDLFKIGIGPSSSHTVGPMRAAKQFAAGLQADGLLAGTATVKAEMYGSLGVTGKAHGTRNAVLLGLEGEDPETVDVDAIADRVAAIRETNSLRLMGARAISYTDQEDLVLQRRKVLPYHPNGMRFTAFDDNGEVLVSRIYYSVGGGFVVDENAARADCIIEDTRHLPYQFHSGAELLALCEQRNLSISTLMWENEKSWRSEEDIKSGLLRLWQAMQKCVNNGVRQEGQLPGGLKLKRRAPGLHRQLLDKPEASLADPIGGP